MKHIYCLYAAILEQQMEGELESQSKVQNFLLFSPAYDPSILSCDSMEESRTRTDQILKEVFPRKQEQ